MKSTLLCAALVACSVLGAALPTNQTQGQTKMPTSLNWTVVEVAGPITNANGTCYTLMLHLPNSATNPRQTGNMVLSSPTPFTGVAIGDVVASTFNMAASDAAPAK